MDLSFFEGKRVFITGHTGFKGSWLCKILLLAGANITGYSLGSPTTPNLYELADINSGINSIIADIRDLYKLRDSIKACMPEIVIHMAAQPIVRESYRNPVYTYETNVMGAVNILEACRSVDSIRSIINVTTDKVYENKERHSGYRENENLCGHDPYSNSKSCSELVTYSYRNAFFGEVDSPAVSTARSGNVIGGGDFSGDRIIPDCVRAAVKNERIVIRNPNSIRPYQHVLDTLFGYLSLAQLQYADKALEGSYNFGPEAEGCITTWELAEMFCKSWGDKLSWEHIANDGPQEASYLKLDCAKASTVLMWKPKISIEKAIDYTVDWTRCWQVDFGVTKCMDIQIQQIINAYECENIVYG